MRGPPFLETLPLVNPIFRAVLDIEPMPAPRPRARAIRVRGSNKHIASMYSPAEYKAWQKKATEMLAEEREFQALEALLGPVSVAIVVTVPRPKTSKLPHPKPDVDNYAKAVLDAMTDARIWANDSQVAFLVIKKEWGDEASIAIDVIPGVAG